MGVNAEGRRECSASRWVTAKVGDSGRLPLVHVCMAERCTDATALALLLLALTPAQVLGRLPALN